MMRALILLIALYLSMIHAASWVNLTYTGIPIHPYHRSENSLALIPNFGWYIFGGFGGDKLTDCFWNFTASQSLYQRYTQYAYTEGGPSGRYGHRAQFNEKLNKFMTFGGKGENRLYDSLYVYHFPTSKWRMDAYVTAPSARAFHTFNNLPDGNVLTFGGQNHDNAPLADNWLYNPLANLWHKASPSKSPSRRYSHCASSYDNGVILFGGTDGNNLYNDVWIYQNNDWVAINTTSTPPPARKSFSCAAFSNGTFVIYGGDNNKDIFNDIWVFDLTSRAWKTYSNLSVLPSPARTNLGYSAIVDNSFYVFGGAPTISYEDNVLNDIWKFTF